MDLSWIPTGLEYPTASRPVPGLMLVCSCAGAGIAQVTGQIHRSSWAQRFLSVSCVITAITSFTRGPIFQRSFYFKMCLRPQWGNCQPARAFQKGGLLRWHGLHVHVVIQHGEVPVPDPAQLCCKDQIFWQLLLGTLVFCCCGFLNLFFVCLFVCFL